MDNTNGDKYCCDAMQEAIKDKAVGDRDIAFPFSAWMLTHQAQAEGEEDDLALYTFKFCPFCGTKLTKSED